MTPKEKAKELVNKFSDLEDGEMYIGKAKQCALIAVDEVLNNILVRDARPDERTEFWQEVKKEIENLEI